MASLQNAKPRLATRLKFAREAAERWKKTGKDENLKRTEAVVKILAEAVRSGIIPISRMSVAVKKDMKFIAAAVAKLSRGDKVTVLGFTGDWFRVNTADGTEGWLHQGELFPELPVELSSKDGVGGSSAGRDEVEIGGRG